jgi:hypothetical protein
MLSKTVWGWSLQDMLDGLTDRPHFRGAKADMPHFRRKLFTECRHRDLTRRGAIVCLIVPCTDSYTVAHGMKSGLKRWG